MYLTHSFILIIVSNTTGVAHLKICKTHLVLSMIYTTCVLLTVICFECYTIYLPYHLFNNILISNIFNDLCKMALSHNRNAMSLQQLQISRLQRSWMHIISIKLPRNWLVYRTVYPLESAYVNDLTRSPVQITLTLTLKSPN